MYICIDVYVYIYTYIGIYAFHRPFDIPAPTPRMVGDALNKHL